MRNSIIAGLCLAFLALGYAGGRLDEAVRNQDEINSAWDDITVVADGTLIANPASYAYNPAPLANARNVRIIDNQSAAIDAANQAVVETAITLNR